VIVLRLKSVEEMCLSPTRTRTHVHISVALVAQNLNVRQIKLGTFIIQTVQCPCILQHDSADTGSLQVKDFVEHNPSHFQIIQRTLKSTIQATSKYPARP
jgi:hypothetical protein